MSLAGLGDCVSASRLRSRVLAVENVTAVADWLREEFAFSGRVRDRLQTILIDLIRSRAIKGILIEDVSNDGAVVSLVGLGVSFFLTAELVEFYVTRPFPFLFADVIERVAAGERVVLDLDGIAQANSGPGLNLIVQYLQRGWDLADPYWREVGGIGHKTYVQHHSGYHLRRALQEDWTTNAGIYLAAGYRELAVVPVAGRAQAGGEGGPTRTIFYADESDVLSRAPGSSVSYVFHRRAPVCGFTPYEQDVLSLGISGATDSDIADALGVTLAAIKHAWQNIYERLGNHVSYVLPSSGDGRRGPEKRRRVLAFVEQHPEELRPFAKPGRTA